MNSSSVGREVPLLFPAHSFHDFFTHNLQKINSFHCQLRWPRSEIYIKWVLSAAHSVHLESGKRDWPLKLFTSLPFLAETFSSCYATKTRKCFSKVQRQGHLEWLFAIFLIHYHSAVRVTAFELDEMTPHSSCDQLKSAPLVRCWRRSSSIPHIGVRFVHLKLHTIAIALGQFYWNGLAGKKTFG